MTKFPIDAPKNKVREGNHISMIRQNPDGTNTPLTMPNHRYIKSSTLRTICSQAGIARQEFLDAYCKRG